jgi:hydrogenase expression/formation protein HypE
MTRAADFPPSCPLPIADYPHVLLAHGGGGRLMHQLVEKMFLPAFGNALLDTRHDGALIHVSDEADQHRPALAFSTDSYVVHPLFFPGGDIGTLAVNGTVNDLAMCGARPLYLSVALIIEEGLPMETLWRVVQSMHRAAEVAQVQIVTGDTKVVDKGKGDGIFINTTGIGRVTHRHVIAPQSIRPDDVVLLSGDVGRHGMAIMAVREGLAFESTIESDCAPLASLVLELLEAGLDIHCLRDLTRGGLATALVELADAAHLQIAIDERQVPVHEDVQGACEILGLDPFYVANEGRFVVCLPAPQVERALAILQAHPLGREASIIGQVTAPSEAVSRLAAVTMRTRIGARRIIDMLSGEQLPRIC